MDCRSKAHGRNREAACGEEGKGLGGGSAGSGTAEPCLIASFQVRLEMWGRIIAVLVSG